MIGRLAAAGYLDHVIFGVVVFVISLFVLTIVALIYMCVKSKSDRPSQLAFKEEKYKEMIEKI